MEFIAVGAAWLSNAPSLQQMWKQLGFASLIANESIAWSSLEHSLSPNATVVFPGQSAFADLSSRWTNYQAPEVRVVVSVYTESDVQETIRFANEHDLPFVAKAGGHGATGALAEAKHTVLIDLQSLNTVRLSADGHTASVGGGVKVKQLTNELWTAGKQTVTGICECVGVSAPVLGGGHGWLQGKYGLAADQIISARVVLPSGDAVTASADTNPDLFWALRGAGHNFGLVTEWEYKVYDIDNPEWSYEIFIFSGDKLEAVFEWTNEALETQPKEAIHWMYILKLPDIDNEHPILMYIIIYDGPSSKARDYAKPLHDFSPLSVSAGESSMPGLAAVTIMSEDDVSCAKGLSTQRFPIGLKTFHVPSVRKVYEEMERTMRQTPELSGTVFLLEGYSTQGVQAVDERTTAFPHRADRLLITSYVGYLPNATVDPIAQRFGENMRRFLLEGGDDPGRLRAYVNYAHGDEPLQAVYGWDDWRLEKLRALKSKWDPDHRMRFYNPIV